MPSSMRAARRERVRAPFWRRALLARVGGPDLSGEACSQRYDEVFCRARSRRVVPSLSWPRCVALAAVAETTATKDHPAPRATPTGRARSRASSSMCCGWAAPSTRSAASTCSSAPRAGTSRARAARCHCTAQARRAWVIDLRRLGCGCGRRLVTGSRVIHETTQTDFPWSRQRIALSIYLYPGSKFESSCGWPAFDKSVGGSVRVQTDFSLGRVRSEIVCAGCGGHLGRALPTLQP